MAKGSYSNAQRYKYPLPIRPIDASALPELYIWNPVSWCYWLYQYYQQSQPRIKWIDVAFIGGDNYKHIWVNDPEGVLWLWENGFFGSGTLSRSEPTWNRRRDESGAITNNDIALESITRQRRLDRLEFKRQRDVLEKELAELKAKSNDGNEETLSKLNQLLEEQRLQLRQFKSDQQKNDISERVNGSKTIKSDPDHDNDVQESLELMPVEAMFLSWALPVLNLSSPLELTSHMNSRQEWYKFVCQYVAYHHYRSHGWCVRSGIKFGCDYLLYKRGPPFQHAEFCIMVMNPLDSHEKDYTWYSRISRVTSGAKKTLILCYLNDSSNYNIDKLWEMWQSNQYQQVFQQFTINEVIYKRWVPGKNRD